MKAANSTTSDISSKTDFTVGRVGLQFLDTTWRIATPVLLFTAAGIWLDLQLGTKPGLTLMMVLVGFVVAGWMVKKQIAAIEKEDK